MSKPSFTFINRNNILDSLATAGHARATTRRALLFAGAGAALATAAPGAAGQRDPVLRPSPRAGTWATAPTAVEAERAILVADQTIRQVVHLSLGGDQPVVHLTNRFGDEPVRLGAVRIGVRARRAARLEASKADPARLDGAGTAMRPDTIRTLTFGGSGTAELPPGGTLGSDPADLVVPAGADLVISIYLPEPTRIRTASPRSFQTSVLADGDVTAEPAPTARRRSGRWFYLAGVSVRTHRSAAAIAVLGDSITCGVGTQQNTNHRWPDLLATRLRVQGRDRGVLNAGISGNRLLTGYEQPTGRARGRRPGHSAHIGPAALRRFDRDVLAHPGVRFVVALIGVNDLGRVPGTTAEDLIAGYRELAARARRAGLKMIGGTMLPFGGARGALDTPANQTERTRFNTWLRFAGELDGVIDFDAAVRDPRFPRRMRSAYDSGDGLHPNAAGMGALAAGVPLEVFA